MRLTLISLVAFVASIAYSTYAYGQCWGGGGGGGASSSGSSSGGGASSGGGGGSSGGGQSASSGASKGGGSMPEVRDTHLVWNDSGLEEATTESGDAVSAAKGITIDLDRWQESKKPALVYWTWSDEEDKRGKDTKKADRNTWDNEQVARAARLYTCYRVDAKDVPQATLTKLGVSQIPFVQVIDAEKHSVASTAPGAATGMENFLRAQVQKHFAEYWRAVLARTQELAKKLDEAKAAMKKKDFDAAVAACSEIMNDDVRADTFDKARDLIAKGRAKAAKEDAKK